MYQITEWRERYEVNLKGSAAGPGDELRKGPLKFIRLQVHGFALGKGLRILQAIAKARAMEVFGIFCKFLEIAGSSRIIPETPEFSRQGILREKPNGNPANIEDLAFTLGVSESQIAHALNVLTDNRLGWLRNLPEKIGNDRKKSDSLQEPSTTTVTSTINHQPSMAPSKEPCANDIRFSQFWNAWPHKVDKGNARQVWKKLKPSGELTTTILVAISAQSLTTQWTKNGGQYIPGPAKWLRAEAWTNDVRAMNYGEGASTVPPAARNADGKTPIEAKKEELGL